MMHLAELASRRGDDGGADGERLVRDRASLIHVAVLPVATCSSSSWSKRAPGEHGLREHPSNRAVAVVVGSTADGTAPANESYCTKRRRHIERVLDAAGARRRRRRAQQQKVGRHSGRVQRWLSSQGTTCAARASNAST